MHPHHTFTESNICYSTNIKSIDLLFQRYSKHNGRYTKAAPTEHQLNENYCQLDTEQGYVSHP